MESQLSHSVAVDVPFYLGGSDVDYCCDDGWIGEPADDEHLADLHCDSSHFGTDELVLTSVCSFLVDGKNHSHCLIMRLPHCEHNSNTQNYLAKKLIGESFNLQSSSRPTEAIALRSFVDPKMHVRLLGNV